MSACSDKNELCILHTAKGHMYLQTDSEVYGDDSEYSPGAHIAILVLS